MRISVAFAIAAVLATSAPAQSPKSQFFTSSESSVHLNPAYTATLVKFIDAHDK